jgi:hypothetical protein
MIHAMLSRSAWEPGQPRLRPVTVPFTQLAGICALAFALGTTGCSSSSATGAGLDEDGPAPVNETIQADNTWRSELYPGDWTPPTDEWFEEDAFIQDYSYAGYARGEKPIPTFADATVLSVLDYGADPTGASDSTAAIQKTIDNAAALKGDTVVYLPAGTYHIQPQGENKYALLISKSNLVLRGDGPDKTRLLNTATEMRGKQIIRVQGDGKGSWKVEETPASPLAWDLLSPTTVIPLEDASGFKPGDMVIIRADPTSEWIKEHKEDGWLGYEDKLGSIRYLRRIQSVDTQTNEITIDIPTRYALKVRDHARVHLKSYQLENVGLEDFAIANVEHPGQDGWGVLDFAAPDSAYTKRLAEGYDLDPNFAQKRKSAYDAHASYVISLYNVVDGWIENVESYLPEGNTRGSHMLSNGIRLYECLNVSVIDCTMKHTLYGGGGGNGYMFRLDNSNECLVQGCHAEAARHGYSLSGMATSGNVLYQCFDKDTATQAADPYFTTGRGSDNHMWFSHSNLVDSCTADNSWFEARDRYYEKMSEPKHNTTSTQTVFWNMTGLSNSYHPFVVWSVQGGEGYVIGTQGAVNGVNTEGNYPERKVVTDPVDRVEGIGEGASLEPQSLFMDQRARRLGQ